MARFQIAVQYGLVAKGHLNRLMMYAGIVEKDMVVADLAYESMENIDSYIRTMLSGGYTTFEYKYNGLLNLCSYLNTRVSN